jgi:TonB family protein
MAALSTCKKCNFELALPVRYCPKCGETDPSVPGPLRDSTSGVSSVSPRPSLQFERPSSDDALPAPGPSTADKQLPKRQEAVFQAESPPTEPPRVPLHASVAATKRAKAKRWTALVAVLVFGLAWFVKPLFMPSDPCGSTPVSNGLDQARAALLVKDHRGALSSSTALLATCTDGVIADELRRIQEDALKAVISEGRRCLRNLDVACIDRVTTDLPAIATHQAAQAFTNDVERAFSVRTERGIKEAQRCVEAGNVECAEQKLQLPLTLRPNDASVQELKDQLVKSRAALNEAQACMAGIDNECVVGALENLRRSSPLSPLIRGLEQRAQAAAQPPTPFKNEALPAAPRLLPPESVAAPVARPVAKPALGNVAACAPKNDDYPAAAVRAEATGTTRIRFAVDASGRLASAEVVKPAGTSREHRQLDRVALAKLSECTFKPGSDETGRAVGGTFEVEYVWKLE